MGTHLQCPPGHARVVLVNSRLQRPTLAVPECLMCVLDGVEPVLLGDNALELGQVRGSGAALLALDEEQLLGIIGTCNP